ncbi:MAG: hypothetical protein LCH67_03690 [Bacteroidetes bacterium]|nr:hypothetical protein [Bacteroidota bacterium]
MKKLSIILLFLALRGFGFSQTVKINSDIVASKTVYAMRLLENTLGKAGYKLRDTLTKFTIDLKIDSLKFGPESFGIIPSKTTIRIVGGDSRGLIYGSLALCENIRNGVALDKIKATEEKPRYTYRNIKFDLPYDTYRHSYALDLHQETCKDIKYWESFLDMMAENRFNILSLWNLHPYVYMIRAKNFPEASPFSDAEMKEWQTLFHGILRLAKEREIETYLVPFNIFVSPEFSKAHNVAMDNLEHHFFVRGDTSEIIKRYTRESVAQVLQEYPELTGFGLTLGEGMAGMSPQEREDWMKETIIEGMRLSGRKCKLIHRIPFSSNVGSLGPTSIETERLTRKAIDEEGTMDFIEKPIWADFKYNWSHAHSTPTLVKVHGGKLFDTYFVPKPETYKVTWTARNEDFFCLRWGVPDFIRSHIKENNQEYVGGYTIGSETYIPAKDYFTKSDIKVDWKYAFERQWLFYKLWGRLLYNPDTPDAVFQAEFTNRYGKDGKNLLKASSLAGKTPLRLASSFDFTWDFSLYSEGFLSLKDKTVSYIDIIRQIEQPVTEPSFVSIADFVKIKTSGGNIESGKVTPPMLAEMLEKDCRIALELTKNINTKNNNTLMYEVADVCTWAYLGLYYSEKIKGGVALQVYRMTGDLQHKQKSITHLEAALKFWDEVIAITKPIYNDMPLVHFTEQSDNTKEQNEALRFHWHILRPEVANDIEIAKNLVYEK